MPHEERRSAGYLPGYFSLPDPVVVSLSGRIEGNGYDTAWITVFHAERKALRLAFLTPLSAVWLGLQAVPAQAASVPCTADEATNGTNLVSAITTAQTGGGGTITLDDYCVYGFTDPAVPATGFALPSITTPITIDTVSGSNTATLKRLTSTSNLFGFFQIITGGSLTINDVALQNGYLFGGIGGAFQVLNDGTLTSTRNLTIEGNRATDGGGGIFVGDSAVVDLTGSVIKDNTSFPSLGGGIYTAGTTSVTLTDVTITGNRANQGGGIFDAGPITMTGGTISNNTAVIGGGVMTADTFDLSGTTVKDNRARGTSGNEGGTGGGIALVGGTTTLTNSQVLGNTVTRDNGPAGGGVWMTAGALNVSGGTLSGNRLVGQNGRAPESSRAPAPSVSATRRRSPATRPLDGIRRVPGSTARSGCPPTP